MSAHNTTPAFARTEPVRLTADEIFGLHALREKLPAVNEYLQLLLELQGDVAEPELVALQHAIAELMPAPPAEAPRI